MGFPSKWLEWTSTLLSSVNTKILLNCTPRRRVCHARGLHQGDSLSLLLFILVMEPLNTLLRKADHWRMFQPLSRGIPHRAAFYADDLMLFLRSISQDMTMARQVFSIFEGASGLGCNLSQSQMELIHCDDEQIQLATSLFPCQVVQFPVRYLGIHLSVKKKTPEISLPGVGGQVGRSFASVERKTDAPFG
jgi:hypothetical protein